MDNRTIQKYWQEVIRRSFNEIWEEMTMRVVVVACGLFILMAFVSGLLLMLGLIPDGFFADRVAEARAGTYAFLISIGVFVVLLIIAIYKTPVQMHLELGGFIENPFMLTPREPVQDNRAVYDPRSASLTVENISPFRIEQCFLTVDKILDENGIDRLYSRQRTLSWSSGEAQEVNSSYRVNHPLDVISGVLRVVDIAEAALEKLTLTVWRGEQLLPVGTYEMHITAHGTWKGYDVSKSEIFIVEYKGGNTVEVKEKLK